MAVPSLQPLISTRVSNGAGSNNRLESIRSENRFALRTLRALR